MSKPKIKVQINAHFADLIPSFLSRRMIDLEEIKKALESGSFEAIGHIGHRLKGNGASYGFQKLTDIGALLETAAKKQHRSEISNLAQEMNVYLESLEIEYVEKDL